jgi:outer membrane protein TolC
MMNRVFIYTILLLIGYIQVAAQVPANRNLPASLARAPESGDTANENRLVALALNGPEYDASGHQNRINELELKKAKGTWLNLLSISTQYNDQTFAKPPTINGQPAYVYPKYFFGLTIPLGIIFSQGGVVKSARESLAYARDQQEALARTIKANVLSKYKQYKLYNDLIEMQSELINDVLAMSSTAEDNFKKGAITVESYIAAQRAKNEEQAKLKNLQLSQDLIKIDLERMIGVPLQSVLNVKPSATPARTTPKTP